MSRSIAVYLSMPDEVNTDGILQVRYPYPKLLVRDWLLVTLGTSYLLP